jgi:hypothetical protein
MNEKLQLVTLEQAKRLKELGFNWECDSFYWGDNEDDLCFRDAYHNHNDGTLPADYEETDGEMTVCSAPSVALALQWVRDNYSNEGEVEKGNIIFNIKATFGSDGVFYVPFIHVFKKGKRYDVGSPDFPCETFGFHRKYGRAESMLLDELLIIILETYKEK